MVMYSYCCVHVFLLLCMSCSVYSVSSILFYILFVCKCVLYYCQRVSTQLQLTNISNNNSKCQILRQFWAWWILSGIQNNFKSCCILSFRWVTGVWILCANVSGTFCLFHLRSYNANEDGTECSETSVQKNSPQRKNTTFRTRRKVWNQEL
jgi:hypothetical protein